MARPAPTNARTTFGRVRFGVAIDLHATAAQADEVAWGRIREQVIAAEQARLDLVVLPDHLEYRAGGDGDYAVDDATVGARESTALAAAIAASTSTIGIGHSVVNAPYRSPVMLAHIASTIADVSGGRYSHGLGVGNSYDYDQLGVDATNRVARFEEYAQILTSLLRDGTADLDGRYWTAERAELTLRPNSGGRPPVVIAAGGPRTMRTAARFGDAWNGWLPTDPDATGAREMLELLAETCELVGRDPATIGRTVDIAVDPLDLSEARSRSLTALSSLRDLGIDEVRCYPLSHSTHESRVEAIEAFAELVAEL